MENEPESVDTKNILRRICGKPICKIVFAVLLASMVIFFVCAYYYNPTENEMVRYINETGMRTKPLQSGGTFWLFHGLTHRTNYYILSTFKLFYGDAGWIENSGYIKQIPESKTRDGMKRYIGICGLFIDVSFGVRRLSRGEHYWIIHWEDDDFEWPGEDNIEYIK